MQIYANCYTLHKLLQIYKSDLLNAISEISNPVPYADNYQL
jgi:hypothetical protein